MLKVSLTLFMQNYKHYLHLSKSLPSVTNVVCEFMSLYQLSSQFVAVLFLGLS